MGFAELTAAARDALTVRRVFAEPVEKDGATIIAAARVRGGGGGGGGHDAGGDEGEGGGFGVSATPAGAFVVRGGAVSWRPAVDVIQLAVTIAAVAIVYLVTRSRVQRARLRAGLAKA
jgi:uncharacterized spore protein YtfJ